MWLHEEWKAFSYTWDETCASVEMNKFQTLESVFKKPYVCYIIVPSNGAML